LSSKRDGNSGQLEERSRRQERADRILDAAAELVQRWGYRKTTVDDIARQAGVAKGTVYLHWKAREDLFIALLRREDLKLVEDIRQRIANDPAGSTLRGLVKHATLALMKRPLMKALFLNDSDMLGEWASREHSSATYQERIENYKILLEFLRDHGVVRTDMGIRELVYMLSAVWMGFLLVDRWMPEEFKFSDEEAVEMLAEAVQRTLAARDAATGKEIEPDASTLQEVSHALNQYIDQEVSAIKKDMP